MILPLTFLALTLLRTDAPGPQGAETLPSLCTVQFGTLDLEKIAGEAMGCGDDIGLVMQRNPEARLVLVGQIDPVEPGGIRLATQRAANLRAYLVQDRGIEASRILLRTQVPGERSVSATFVPDQSIKIDQAFNDSKQANLLGIRTNLKGNCVLLSGLISARTASTIRGCS